MEVIGTYFLFFFVFIYGRGIFRGKFFSVEGGILEVEGFLGSRILIFFFFRRRNWGFKRRVFDLILYKI